MLRKYNTIILIFMLSCLYAFGQDPLVLKGKVVEEGTGESLIGVTVIEINDLNRSLNGTVTDLNGNFALRLSSSNTIVKISYIGFKTEEHSISGQTYLDISLEEETQLLDEVVVRKLAD